LLFAKTRYVIQRIDIHGHHIRPVPDSTEKRDMVTSWCDHVDEN